MLVRRGGSGSPLPGQPRNSTARIGEKSWSRPTGGPAHGPAFVDPDRERGGYGVGLFNIPDFYLEYRELYFEILKISGGERTTMGVTTPTGIDRTADAEQPEIEYYLPATAALSMDSGPIERVLTTIFRRRGSLPVFVGDRNR